jgi:hypothetical protein
MRDPKGVEGMTAEKKVTKRAAPKKQAWRLARDLKTDRRPAETVEVGSEVQLVLGSRNAYPGYDVLKEQALPPFRPTQGLVASIRDIRSGELVAVATGDLGQYVFEVIHVDSFRPGFGSVRNATGADTPGGLTASPAWKMLRKRLRDAARKGKLVSHATGTLGKEITAGLLDGWRASKVRAADLVIFDESPSTDD